MTSTPSYGYTFVFALDEHGRAHELNPDAELVFAGTAGIRVDPVPEDEPALGLECEPEADPAPDVGLCYVCMQDAFVRPLPSGITICESCRQHYL